MKNRILKLFSNILYFISLVTFIGLLSFGIYGAILGRGTKQFSIGKFQEYMKATFDVEYLRYFLVGCIIYLIGYLVYELFLQIKNKSNLKNKKFELSKLILIFTFCIYNILFGIGIFASVARNSRIL